MMKLLIVDDDLISRIMLEEMTRKWGFEVVLAENGEQAWGILQQPNRPNLMLVDWEMPVLNGLALCERVREHLVGEPPYIIFLTGHTDKSDVVTGLEKGADDYVTKPFNTAELKARLLVGHRLVNMQQELREIQTVLEYEANYDVLTKLMNRRAILGALKKVLAKAERRRLYLGLGMCDIDHFKRINDQYGHPAGDQVLREVARRMQVSLRPYDYIGRFGGEEFLILMELEDENSEDMFDRIRRAVNRTPVVLDDGTELTVTISLGCLNALIPKADCNEECLISLADQALYQAKAEGRNRTVAAKIAP